MYLVENTHKPAQGVQGMGRHQFRRLPEWGLIVRVFYKDGNAYDTTRFSIPMVQDMGNTLVISSPDYGTGCCDFGGGYIDEVRIYNQALSQAEIQKHYVEGLKRHQLAINP